MTSSSKCKQAEDTERQKTSFPNEKVGNAG